MTRQQLIATVVACGGKAPRVKRVRKDCGTSLRIDRLKHFSWRAGRRPTDPPAAWTPQGCEDSDVDLFAGVIRR